MDHPAEEEEETIRVVAVGPATDMQQDRTIYVLPLHCVPCVPDQSSDPNSCISEAFLERSAARLAATQLQLQAKAAAEGTEMGGWGLGVACTCT